MDQSNDKPGIEHFFIDKFLFIILKVIAENVATSTTKPTSQGQNPASGAPGEPTSGEWYSVSARQAGAGTAYPDDRGEGSEGGSTRGGSDDGRGSDMRKQSSFTINKS